MRPTLEAFSRWSWAESLTHGHKVNTWTLQFGGTYVETYFGVSWSGPVFCYCLFVHGRGDGKNSQRRVQCC